MRSLFLTLTALLAGCDREPATVQPPQLPIPSGPPAPQAPPPDRAAAPRPALQWQTSVGPGGTTLLLRDSAGKLLLSLACGGEPPRLNVTLPDFEPIGSEDRLSFGLDDDPVALVADPLRQREGEGVSGEGPLPEGFMGRLAGARTIAASYGARQVGPHPAPPAAAAKAFDEGCAERR